MKRTIVPQNRKRFPQENISIKIEERGDDLMALVKLRGIANYPKKAQIILEAFNRINIARIDLGLVENYQAEEQEYPIPFSAQARPKINFRLKIINTTSYELLGYAENLKEEKYAGSLLETDTDETISNLYRIDLDNDEHPILYINQTLGKNCIDKIKPILAEVALKEILTYVMRRKHEIDNLEEHKWFVFANKLVQYDNHESDDEERDLDWVNEVLNAFSKDKKLVAKIKKLLDTDD